MREILTATSVLLLLSASAGVSLSNDLPDELSETQQGASQGVDPMPTAGIAPLRALTRGHQAANEFLPSEENNLPDHLRANDPFNNNEAEPNGMVADSPILRPLAGEETETFSARDEDTLPEDQPVPGG